jgi:hypothetical protein
MPREGFELTAPVLERVKTLHATVIGNSSSATQEITLLLWKPKVHSRGQKSSPRFPVLSQMNPVHTHLANFSKVYFNIILPTRLCLASNF